MCNFLGCCDGEKIGVSAPALKCFRPEVTPISRSHRPPTKLSFKRISAVGAEQEYAGSSECVCAECRAHLRDEMEAELVGVQLLKDS